MATLAIGLIVYEIAVQWQSVTQGYMGISGIPPLGIGRWTVTSDRGLLVLLMILAAIAVLAAARIRRSRLRARVRRNRRQRGCGPGARHRRRALQAHRLPDLGLLRRRSPARCSCTSVGFVSPEVFGLHMVVLAFTMLYVGGIGTISGRDARRADRDPAAGDVPRASSDYQDLAYGAALIVILIFAPGAAWRRCHRLERPSESDAAHERVAPSSM